MVSGLPDFSKYVVLKGSEVTLDVDVVGSVTLDVNVVGSVVLDVNIKSQAVTLNVNIESQSVTLDVKITGSDVTLNVNVTNASIKVDIGSPLDANGNVKTAIVDSVQIDVNIAASAVTLDVNIKSQAVTLDVNIKAQDVTLNVNVQGTASVSIDNATVYLNVKNELWTVDETAFDNRASADTLISDYAGVGILFRGVRGAWKGFGLRVKELSGSDQYLTICVAIDPWSPPLIEKRFKVPANADGDVSNWFFWDIWWNYDTAFIYIKENNSNVQIYAQYPVWTHGFRKTGIGEAEACNIVLGMVLQLHGSRFGHLPVSGTVNIIQIPNTVTQDSGGGQVIDAGATVELGRIEGCGKLIYLLVHTDYELMEFIVEVDGNTIQWGGQNHTFRPDRLYGLDNYQYSRGWRLLRYDPTNGFIYIESTLPIPFKRSLVIKVHNPDSNSHGATLQQLIAETIS